MPTIFEAGLQKAEAMAKQMGLELARSEEEVIEKLLKKYPDKFPNRMLVPKLFSVVINCSVGKSGEPLEKARKILEEMFGKKPKLVRARKTIKQFGIHKKQPMGWVITLRGQEAFDFLKIALTVYDFKVWKDSMDKHGNFSFGIDEHIRLPGTRYDPELGTIGFDVCVTMERAGYRVARRRLRKTKIPNKHKLTKEEVILYLQEMGLRVVPGGKPEIAALAIKGAGART